MSGNSKVKAKAKRKRQPALDPQECVRIKAHLMSLACTEAWAETIMASLNARDHHGRLIVKYQVDQRGRLKTKMPQLLEAIADALVYPPASDDKAKPHVGHVGSTMLPCLCRQCTRTRDGVSRHVWWPASYMVRGVLSYTCAVNRMPVDPDACGEHELLLDRGRGIMPGDAAGQMRVDPNAWRQDKITRLAWADLAMRLNPREQLIVNWTSTPEAFNAWYDAFVQSWVKWITGQVSAHRWRQVVGGQVNHQGALTSKAKNILRGLNNIGSMADFLDLGHSFTQVQGINLPLSVAVTDMVQAYPREPRMRFVRIRFKKTTGGK